MSDEFDSYEDKSRAEGELRRALAAEKKAEREMREKIQKGFYGCIAILVVIFVLLMFFTGR